MLFQKSQVGRGVRLLSRKLSFAQNRGKAVPTLRIRTYLYEDRQTFQESEQVFHFSSKAEALAEADRITEAFLSQDRAEAYPLFRGTAQGLVAGRYLRDQSGVVVLEICP